MDRRPVLSNRVFVIVLLVVAQLVSREVEADQRVLGSRPIASELQDQSEDEETRAQILALIKTVASKDEKVDFKARSKALEDLIDLGMLAVPQLVEAVDDDSWGRSRVSFLTALRSIGPPAEKVLPVLVKATKSPDSGMRLSAVMGLSALGVEARPALSALVRLQGDPDEMVREAARDAIVLVDKPLDSEEMTHAQRQRVSSLIDDLLSDDPLKSLTAKRHLGQTGRSAVPALLAQLEERRGTIERLNLLSALTEIGPEAEAAVPSMIRLLAESKDHHGAIRVLAAIGPGASEAAPVLAGILEKPGIAEVYGADASIALGRIGKTATPYIPRILALCDLGSDYARRPFVDALQLIASSDASSIPMLCDALDSPVANVRCIVARALAELGSPASLCQEDLLRAAQVGTPDSRFAAVLALSRSGPPRPEYVDSYIPLLRDREVAVRKTTIEILTAAGAAAKDAVPVLVELTIEDESRRVRRLAIGALQSIAPEQSLPPHENPPVADWITVTDELRERDSSPVEGLSVDDFIDLLEDRKSEQRVASLGEKAFPYVSAGLTHPDPWKRRRFAMILASIEVSAERVLPGLRWALEDDSHLVRKQAAKTIPEIVGPKAPLETRRSIAFALLPLFSDEDPNVRWEAVEGVMQLEVRDSRLIPPLIDRLTDGETFVRTTSMRLLGSHGPMAVSCVPAVVEVLDDYVRTARPGYAKMPNAEAAAACLQGIGPAASAAAPALRRALDVSNVRQTRDALSSALEAIGRKVLVTQVPPVESHSISEDNSLELIAACYSGDLNSVKRLLGEGANVDSHMSTGFTALMAGAVEGHLAVVRYLVSKGARVNRQSIEGRGTALMLAAMKGHTSVVEFLIREGAQVNVIGEDGWTALVSAVSANHRETAEVLLKGGANIHAETSRGFDSFKAAIWARYDDLALLLLDRGASISSRTKDGRTPLMLGATVGNDRLVNELLSRGANVGDKKADGWTALMGAAYGGHRDLVRLLIEKGADVNARKNDGTSVLHHVVGRSQAFNEIIAWVVHETPQDQKNAAGKLDREVVRILLQAGAKANAQDDNGNTPLMLSVSWGNVSIVELLLANGADVNIRNAAGLTAVDIIEGEEYLDMLHELKRTLAASFGLSKKPDWRKQFEDMLRKTRPSQATIMEIARLLRGKE